MNERVNTVDLLEKELSRLLAWSRAAESRLALVLPLATAMLGSLAVLAPAATEWTPWKAMVTSFAALALVLSLICAACAFFPRTTGPKGSLIYFGGIVDKDLAQYTAAVRELEVDDYVSDLIRQCHRNAQIAERKYAWAQKAVATLFLGAAPWALALLSLYAGRQ